MSIRMVSRVLLVCAACFLILAGGVSLYTSGFISELQRGALSSDSPPTMRASFVRELERLLGTRGAGRAVREYVSSRDETALRPVGEQLRAAGQVVQLYTDQVNSEQSRQGARDLRGLMTRYRQLHEDAKKGTRPELLEGRLDGLLAELTALTQSLHNKEVMARIEAATSVAATAQGAIVLVVLGVFAFVLASAIILRARIYAPLEDLARDAQDLTIAIGGGADIEGPVWGADRKDEIGTVARVIEQLARARQSAFDGQGIARSPDGRLMIELSGPSGQVLDQVLDQLRTAVSGVDEQGKLLDRTREETAEAANDSITRLNTAADSVRDLRKDLTESMTKTQREASQAVTQIDAAAKGLMASDDALRNAADRLVTRVSDGAADIETLTKTASERLSSAVEGLQNSHEAISAVMTDVHLSNERLGELASTAKSQILDAVGDARDKSAAMTETAGGLATLISQIEASVNQTCRSFDEASTTMTTRLSAAVDHVDAAARKTDAVSTAIDSHNQALAERGAAQGALMEAFGKLRDQVTAGLERMAEGRAEHAPDLLTLEATIQTIAEGLVSIRSDVKNSLDRSATYGDAVTAAGEKLDRVVSGIADSLTHIAGQVGRAVDEQGMGQSALSRYHEETRSALQTLSDRLEDMARQADRPAIDTDSGGLSPAASLEELRVAIDEALAPLVTAMATAANRPWPDFAGALDEITGRIDAMADRLADMTVGEQDTDGSQALAEEVKALHGDMVERFDQLGSNLRDGTLSPEDREAGLTNLRDLSERIELAARTLFDRIQGADAGDPADALKEDSAPVIASLRDLAEAMRGSDLPGPDEDTVLQAAQDVITLTDMIDRLESRASALARHMAHSPAGSSAGEVAPDEAARTEQALVRLQMASAKLGNIATAIALASDAHYMRAAE